jgi:glycerol kinase
VTAVLLAIDQGSSASKCLVLSADAPAGQEGSAQPGLTVLGMASCDITTSLPQQGRVEHDPDEITASVLRAIWGAMTRAGVSWTEVSGIGLAAQTETFVVWERATGRPVYPAISWRDGRAAAVCDRFHAAGHAADIRQRTGLPLQPAFTAPKLRWLLDEINGGQRRARAGELLLGDVNCWLTWNLSGRASHVTDPSMASRTMLFSLADLAWDTELLDLFGIPEQMLPEVRSTAGVLAQAEPSVCGGSAVISAAIGDQQSALFAQRCWAAGTAKLTLGTGAFLWCQAGDTPVAVVPAGVVSSCAWQLGGRAAFALEGFVPNAGSIVPWLRGLGVLGDAQWPVIGSGALERAARAGSGGLWCVPALSGLGTPAWSSAASADITGLTANSTAADVAEAALLGVAHQVADAVEAVGSGIDAPLTAIRVDGGMSRNDSLLQALADLSGITLGRARTAEATGLGAGALAGLGTGVWDMAGLEQLLAAAAGSAGQTEPRLDSADKSAVRQAWRFARDRALTGWTSIQRPGGAS